MQPGNTEVGKQAYSGIQMKAQPACHQQIQITLNNTALMELDAARFIKHRINMTF